MSTNLFAFYGKAFAALWDSWNPKPDRVTNYEKQCLRDKGVQHWHLATMQQDAAVIAAVHEIYSKAGAKPPKIIIYDSSKANAMHLNNNTLCISTAKIAQGDPQGFLATVAHEYAHQKQNSLSLTLIFSRLAVILAGAGWATNKLKSHLLSMKSFSSLATVAAFAAFGAGIHYITELPWKAYRRWQERDADACSVTLTGSAEGMIRNLERHAATQKESSGNREAEDAGSKIWAALNRSHDSHEDRIRHLRRIEAERGSSSLTG